MTSKKKFSIFHHVKWEHLAAGVSGGVLSTLALHPLDLIKIRFQVNEGIATVAAQRPQYSGILDALLTIGKKDGLRGLYQGVTPNVWGAGASWGLYFLFYNALKERKLHSTNSHSLPASEHMLAASQSGCLTLLLTNPIWVAKTRLCLQYEHISTPAAPHQPSNAYKGMYDCLSKIYQKEGIKGLYRGFIPGLVGVSHGAIQFMTYEELKKDYNEYLNRPLDTKFSSTEYIALAAISKIIAASVTYPYQVVRSRLQDQHRSYNGLMDVILQTWRRESVVGFYKGLVPYMLHVTPNICIVFLVYEHFINKWSVTAEETAVINTKSLASKIHVNQKDSAIENSQLNVYKNTVLKEEVRKVPKLYQTPVGLSPVLVEEKENSVSLSGHFGKEESLLEEDDILQIVIEEDIS